MRWIYLRKKSAEGEFDIYSDLESKLAHYKRVRSLWASLMCLEFFVGLLNIILGGIALSENPVGGSFPQVNILLGAFVMVIGLLFLGLTMQLGKKIKMLAKEKEIRE